MKLLGRKKFTPDGLGTIRELISNIKSIEKELEKEINNIPIELKDIIIFGIPSIEDVINISCRCYGFTRERLLRKTNVHYYAHRRFLSMVIAHEVSRESNEDISIAYGYKDHTHVTYAKKTINSLMDHPEFKWVKEDYEEINRKIKILTINY